MSQPLYDAGSEPAFLVQSKTVFYVDGESTAMLVLRRGQRMREKAVKFDTAALALKWCQARAVAFVYLPVDPSKN